MANPFGRLFARRADPEPAKPPIRTRSVLDAASSRRFEGWDASPLAGIESAGAFTAARRARAMALNNPWAASGVQALVASGVGAGFMHASGHRNPEIRATLNTAFSRWTESVDPAGRYDLNGLLAAALEGMILDGETILQIVMSDNGPKLAPLSADQLDPSLTRRLSDDSIIVSGVEMSAAGEIRAYHLRPHDPTQTYLGYADPVRVPVDAVIHMFRPNRSGQVRGLSWFAPVLLRLRELDQLEDALTVGAKVAAMHAGFLTNQNALDSGELPYDGGQAGGILNGGLEPGTLKVLPGGMDVKFNTPGQAQQTADFLRSQLRAVAAGLGVPEHLLTGDLGNANYSSLRAGLLEFRRRVELVQYHVIIPQFLRPVWREFIRWSILSGDLDADPSDPDLYKVDWLPPAVESIDPSKDAAAIESNLKLGLTSRRQAVAGRGYAVEDLDEEIAADRARESGLGLNFSTPGEGTQTTDEKAPANDD